MSELIICPECKGKRQILEEPSFIQKENLKLVDCEKCHGLGITEAIADLDAVTHKDYALLARNKEQLHGQITACDNRRKRTMLLCRYNNKGNCTIDKNKKCINQCTFRNRYIDACFTENADLKYYE